MLTKFKVIMIFILTCTTFLQGEYFINDYTKDMFAKNKSPFFQKRFEKFVSVLDSLEKQSEKVKLEKINTFFNQNSYMTDIKNWNVSDYWANTVEVLLKDRADCEDYVIVKYFALKKLDVDPTKMKAFYVKSLKYNTPHMVLAYYEDGSVEPLILDNYNFLILPASKRDDLQPIKFFDVEKLLIAKYKQFGLLVPNESQDAYKWLETMQGIGRKK